MILDHKFSGIFRAVCRELTLSMINFAQSVKYSTYNYIEPKRIELHLHWDNWDIQDING